MWFWKIILTSTLSLFIMFLLCRLNGKRQISQMTMFDYINSITIGSIAAELATNLEQWERPLTAMVIYGLITVGVNKLNCISLTARQLFNGKPTVIMKNGKIDRKQLVKANIDLNEFLTQCRVAGYWNLNQLRAVLLEPNGHFSFLPGEPFRPLTPNDMEITPAAETLWHCLILDGVLQKQALKVLGKDEKWLNFMLSKYALHRISDVLLALSDENGNFFACPVDRQ